MDESSHVLMGFIESLESLCVLPVFLGIPVMLLQELALPPLLLFREEETLLLSTHLLDPMTFLSALPATCANLMAITTGFVL